MGWGKNPEFVGRRKPYTQIGIRRLKCQRCSSVPEYQWQCCANGNRWLPVCERCDIDLNIMVLRFFKIKNRGPLLVQYIENRNHKK